MIQRRERSGLAFEPPEPLAVRDKGVENEFDRDLAPEFGVAGAIDGAHAAGTRWGDDLIHTNSSARSQCHLAMKVHAITPAGPRSVPGASLIDATPVYMRDRCGADRARDSRGRRDLTRGSMRLEVG